LLNSTNKIGRLELKADLKGAEGIGALAASCSNFRNQVGEMHWHSG
jgi:hypothetical protein